MRRSESLLPFALLLILLFLVSACGGGAKANLKVEPPVESSASELARAVVGVVRLKGGDPWKSCSGTTISPDGLILTNSHCVDDRKKEYDQLEISVTEQAESPPVPSFIGEIAAVDYVLDLAVIRVASDLKGNSTRPTLPTIKVGNSDAVQIGDYLRIYGYPGVGGDTITLTDGSVSGFLSEENVAGRAWIKTSVVIGAGSSGGTGLNRANELIGVPTWTDAENCVPVEDTNKDGRIDKHDRCELIGTQLSGLRPVNLAAPLIDAALNGKPYKREPPSEGDGDKPDLSKAHFTNLVFADGFTNDGGPTEVRKALPSNPKSICAFWEYAGMSEKFNWTALWLINGEQDKSKSLLQEPWTGGEDGGYRICLSNDTGHPDGVYELLLAVGTEDKKAEPLLNDAVIVGGNRPTVRMTLTNSSNKTICAVYLKPAGAVFLGQNELEPDDHIDAGETANISVPAGSYYVRLSDCDDNKLGEKDGLDLTKNLQLNFK